MSQYRKPNLEFYRKKAKQLVKQHRARWPEALSLIKYNHGRFTKLDPLAIAEQKFSLRDAQTVVSRIDGYAGWSELKAHVAALNKDGTAAGNKSLRFEKAAESIVQGQIDVLTRWLDQDPGLIKARSRRQHRATLLHYIAANGIEQHRQKTPPNAVAIARLLLERGAEADALAETYGGGNAQTTLSLLVSSGWPHQAGLQSELVRVLCEFGAKPDGLDDDGLPLATALVFFYGDTACALAECGAKTNHLLAAAATGSPAQVDACFTSSGRLKKGNRVYKGFDLRAPRNRIEMLGQAFVYAALCNNLATMKRLHSKYSCPIDAPADRGIRALHIAAYQGHGKVVDWLLQKGADGTIRDHQWNSTAVGWAWQSGQKTIRSRIIDSITLDLPLAVSFFRWKDVRRILAADPNAAGQRDAHGLFPIHHLHGDTEDGPAIIRHLVKHGADINALDPVGRTAVDRLSVKGRDDLVKILRELKGRAAAELS